jgi:hypothetical protein
MLDLPPTIVAALERWSKEPHLELRLLPVDAFYLVATLQRVLRDLHCPLWMRPQVELTCPPKTGPTAMLELSQPWEEPHAAGKPVFGGADHRDLTGG